jgi:hypothetical protein
VTQKLVWLKKVGLDPQMRGLPVSIAIRLALEYFHPDKGYAWVSQGRLARELHCTLRNCQKAMDRMVEAGWLARKVRKRQGVTNCYWLAVDGISDISPRLAAQTDDLEAVGGVRRPRRRGYVASDVGGYVASDVGGYVASDVGGYVASDVQKKGTYKTGEPQEGRRAHARATPTPRPLEAAPLEEASEKHPAGGNNRAAHKPAGGNRATPFPEGWELSAAQLSVAKSIAGWERDRADREFIKFRVHHEEEESKRRHWPAAWEKWCCDGAKFDERDGGRRSNTKKGRRIVTEEDLIDLADDLEQHLLRNNRKQS